MDKPHLRYDEPAFAGQPLATVLSHEAMQRAPVAHLQQLRREGWTRIAPYTVAGELWVAEARWLRLVELWCAQSMEVPRDPTLPPDALALRLISWAGTPRGRPRWLMPGCYRCASGRSSPEFQGDGLHVVHEGINTSWRNPELMSYEVRGSALIERFPHSPPSTAINALGF